MATRIQLRRDTAANWAEFDPVLADGEIAFDETAIELRIGNGTDPWSELPTFGTGGGGGGAVDSVNGHTGVVHLTEDDIPDGTTAKQYTSAEKTKLAGVAAGATQNQSDAYLLDRSHQTGSQVAATISDLAETTQDTVAAMLVAGAHITLTYDDTANTLTITGAAAPVASVAGRTGAVVLSSADLSDVATLVTDDELAAALETALAGYVEAAQLPLLVSDSLAAGANIGLHFDTGTQKTTITAAGGGGGGSVDSVNGQSGIVELDQDDIADGTTAKQYTAAEKTKLAAIAAGAEVNVNADWLATTGDAAILNKPPLGTAAAHDTTDFATAAQGATADAAYVKPGPGIPSTDLTAAVQTSLGKADTAVQPAAVTPLAPLASPAFTGNPTAPTPATSDNDGSIATTAFVQAVFALILGGAPPAALDTLKELADAINDDANFAATVTTALALKAPLASPALTGTPTVPTAAPGTNTTQAASTAFVAAIAALLAPLASPALTGSPTAPTQSPGDNSTKIATTAFVAAVKALLAPLASPALTGSPTAPTQAVGDNSTKIATTAYADLKIMDASGNTYTIQPISQSAYDALGGSYAARTIYLRTA